MQYLCLIYIDETVWPQLPKAEAEKMSAEYFAFTDEIKKNGHYQGGNRLESVKSAATVRVRNGKVSATDGPFAETREQLGGYYLIEATDMSGAIQIAAKIPGARVGSIEVRPIAPVRPAT
jgi:hypothetical protein